MALYHMDESKDLAATMSPQRSQFSLQKRRFSWPEEGNIQREYRFASDAVSLLMQMKRSLLREVRLKEEYKQKLWSVLETLQGREEGGDVAEEEPPNAIDTGRIYPAKGGKYTVSSVNQ